MSVHREKKIIPSLSKTAMKFSLWSTEMEEIFKKLDLIDEFITGNRIRKYLEKGSEYLEHF